MLTKLERLQKAVVFTEAAYYDADAAWDAADAAYYAADAAWDAAEDAQAGARLELEDYLKEQDND